MRGSNAGIAQLVEHDLAKVGVASSSLVSRSKYRYADVLECPWILEKRGESPFFHSGRVGHHWPGGHQRRRLTASPPGKPKPTLTPGWEIPQVVRWWQVQHCRPVVTSPALRRCTEPAASRPTAMASTPRSPGMAMAVSTWMANSAGRASTATCIPPPPQRLWGGPGIEGSLD